MMRRWNKSSRWNKSNLWGATPAIAMSTAILVLIAGLAIAYSGAQSNSQRQIDRATVQSQILASTVTAALAFNDRMAAEEYVSALRSDPEILNAAVYDAGGRKFADFSRLKELPVPERLAVSGTKIESNRVTIVTPVAEGPAHLGSVYLRATIDSPAQRLRRYGTIGMLSTMAAIVVAVLGIAHLTLTKANQDLERQSLELAAANQRLLQLIDEREKVEAALRQAQKMEAIGHLTGGVAHDFNNLLQIILASLDMLQRRSMHWNLAANAMRDFRRYLEAATVGGERAASLTRQLLAFARRQPLEPTKVDVNRLVAGMSELLRRTLGETIAVETVLAGGLWSTFADANQLESALVNLAVNARDAMAEGGRLTIETANSSLDENYVRTHDDLEPGQYVMIAVSDTGSGMTREVIAQAFEPFFTTKDIGRGTGLGLSQVYGFVKQSGGHIKIYSEPDRGTTVKLYLPRLVVASDEVQATGPEKQIPKGTRTETILVVEDEDEVRAFSSEMLRELGYGVMEAADGLAALNIIESVPSIQLLFTDIGLPNGLNGRQLAEEALKRRPELKVLFTSGYARHAVAHSGRLDAGVMLLGKPFTYGALAEKVRQVLNA